MILFVYVLDFDKITIKKNAMILILNEKKDKILNIKTYESFF